MVHNQYTHLHWVKNIIMRDWYDKRSNSWNWEKVYDLKDLYDDSYKKFKEYIDNQMLKISKSSFDTLIKELLSYSLLQENGSNNKCGANSFDTTIKGGEIALQKKEKAMLDLAEITGTFTGTFAGKIVSSLQNNTP